MTRSDKRSTSAGRGLRVSTMRFLGVLLIVLTSSSAALAQGRYDCVEEGSTGYREDGPKLGLSIFNMNGFGLLIDKVGMVRLYDGRSPSELGCSRSSTKGIISCRSVAGMDQFAIDLRTGQYVKSRMRQDSLINFSTSYGRCQPAWARPVTPS